MTIQQQTETLQQQLRYPFPADVIHWRIGSTNQDKTKGLALAYLDARDVMDRLDETFGVSGWESKFFETAKGRIICELSCRFPDPTDPDGIWITKSDGAGDTDYEGEKGAISDALKRAAVSFGIGRYLYRLDAVWVDCEQRGKGVYIKRGCEPKLPPWALPEGPANKPKAPKKTTASNENNVTATDEQVENFLTAFREVAQNLDDHAVDVVLMKHTGDTSMDKMAATRDRSLFKAIYNDLKKAAGE